MNSNRDFRQTLHEITLSHPSAHPRLMHERAANHSIRLLSVEGDDLRYNCVMFALDGVGNQQYLDLLYQLPNDVHADTRFLKYLIEQGHLILSPDGNLIIYFANEHITHIGKINAVERIVSKWGRGHLYEHAIFEVPIEYGDNSNRYEPAKNFDFIQSFKEYIKQI